MTEGRFIGDPRDGAAKVHQHQFHGPTDGSIGAPPLPEDVVPTINLQFLRDRPIDDHQWVEICVEHCTPRVLQRSSSSASTAVITTGR